MYRYNYIWSNLFNNVQKVQRMIVCIILQYTTITTTLYIEEITLYITVWVLMLIETNKTIQVLIIANINC